MQNNYLRFFRYTAMFAALFTIHYGAVAQLIQPAAKPLAAMPLQLCNGVTCPAGFLTTTTTPLRTINADMVTVEDNGFNPVSYPGYFGISFGWDNLWGIAFSGATNNNLNNSTGFTIGSATTGVMESYPIPYWFGVGGAMTGTANDPDIAVGTCYSTQSSDFEHFALVVYELNGDIYMDHYEINIQPGIITTMPPAPFTCPFPPPTYCAIPGNHTPVPLSQGHNASKPHIEIWHTKNIPSASGQTIATKYAVT